MAPRARLPTVGAISPQHLLTTGPCYNPREVNSMANLGGVVQMLKKEHDRLTKQVKAITAALSGFRSAYGKKTRTQGGMSAAGKEEIAAAQGQVEAFKQTSKHLRLLPWSGPT